ncbi:hypothetical protein [Streptomyces sp. NPDC047097]
MKADGVVPGWAVTVVDAPGPLAEPATGPAGREAAVASGALRMAS